MALKTFTSDAIDTKNQYVKARICAKETDISYKDNTTTLEIWVEMWRTNSGHTTYGTGTLYIGVDGQGWDKSSILTSQKITQNSYTKIGSSREVVLEHNSEGKWNANVYAYCNDGTATGLNFGSYPTTHLYIESTIIYTDPNAPIITITDNGNNTFTISASAGDSGVNNSSTGVGGLYYKIGDANWVSCSSGTSASISGSDKTVKGKGYTIGTYSNSEETTTGGITVKYYVKPSSRPTPTLSYNTTRPTPKSTYTINWTAATAGNTNSPIKGYRLRINKLNADGTLGTSLLGSADTASAGGGRYVEVDADSHSYSFTIGDTNTSTSIAVNPKDSIKAGLHVWAEDGSSNHNRLYYDASASALSTALQIQNPGVMHIKVGNAWKEAIPYIKINGEWKEAVPFIKINNAWKEAT